jgi:hypothetical protein
MSRKNMVLKVAGVGLFAIAASFTVATVTAQELQTTSVPFKGTMAKDGEVELVLRLYDQAKGGTKLFEEPTLVDVSQGMYVVFAEVPSEVIVRHATVWMEVAKEAAPDLPLGDRQPFAMKPAGNSPQAVVCPAGGCATFCFTCGGAYPFFNGGFPLAAGSAPIERGWSCAGGLTSQADTFPYLCTQ